MSDPVARLNAALEGRYAIELGSATPVHGVDPPGFMGEQPTMLSYSSRVLFSLAMKSTYA